MTSKCGSCGGLFTKLVGFKRPSGVTVYVNEQGKQWDGRTCPGCKNRRVYSSSESDLGVYLNIDPLTTRRCRICDKWLPASRYFKHVSCESKEEFPYEIDDYGFKSHLRNDKYVW